MGKDKGGKGGVVVNNSSILGLAPFAGSPVYVATKHAVIGLTRSFGVSIACIGVLNFFCALVPFQTLLKLTDPFSKMYFTHKTKYIV
jgi:short-subunit dehydrogenase involved in D-alanine esterification of teichoic acids